MASSSGETIPAESTGPASFRPAILASLALLAGMFALSAWAWVKLPEGSTMPVHWDLHGRPDRYGGKAEGLLLAPFMGLVLAVVFAAIPRFDPRKTHITQSAGAFSVIWVTILLFIFAIHGTLVGIALGARPSLMNDVVPPGIGALFIVIGLSIRNIQSNFIMGVRTPWTLSSERSWRKTHRISGWIFVIYGGLIGLTAMPGLKGAWFVIVTLGGLAVIIPVTMVYSYLAWRDDPDKRTT